MSSKRTEMIKEMLEPAVNAVGMELWGVEFLSQGRHSILRVYIDSDNGVTIDNCEAASHQVSGVLDVEDPISGAYDLEVSSPGIDRPLTRLKDFDRWSGFEAKVELDEAVEGQRRYRGKLTGTEGEDIILLNDAGEKITLPFADLRKAKLVLTDELIAATTGGSKS